MACHAGSSGALLWSSDCKSSTLSYCFDFHVVYFWTVCSKNHLTYLRLFKPLRKNIKVVLDHLQSRGTPWRHCTNHVKARGTLSKMDVAEQYFKTKKPVSVKNPGANFTSKISANQDLESVLGSQRR